MKDYNCYYQQDKGGQPYVENIQGMAAQNDNFRTAVWTGNRLQMTVMSIPPCDDIGMEVHPSTDQLIRVEQGRALVRAGRYQQQIDLEEVMNVGDAIFIPGGTWHNVINIGNVPLKVSSIYTPPNHPKGTVQQTKADAEY